MCSSRCNNIAAQSPELLPCLYQFFVRKRSHKFSAIVFAEFTEPDWAEHRAVLGTGLLLSTSRLTRILFPTPQIIARFNQKEGNRQEQDDRKQYADGRIFPSARHICFTFLSPSRALFSFRRRFDLSSALMASGRVLLDCQCFTRPSLFLRGFSTRPTCLLVLSVHDDGLRCFLVV